MGGWGHLMRTGVHLARPFARTECIGMNGIFEQKFPYGFVVTFSKTGFSCPYQKTLKCQKIILYCLQKNVLRHI